MNIKVAAFTVSEKSINTVDVTLCMLCIFSCFLSPTIFFKIHSFFSKSSFMNTIRVSNSIEPDQARHIVDLTVCKWSQQTPQR